MVEEGSVISSAVQPRGTAVDVAPDGFAHAVFRSGVALSLKLPEIKFAVEESEFGRPEPALEEALEEALQAAADERRAAGDAITEIGSDPADYEMPPVLEEPELDISEPLEIESESKTPEEQPSEEPAVQEPPSEEPAEDEPDHEQPGEGEPPSEEPPVEEPPTEASHSQVPEERSETSPEAERPQEEQGEADPHTGKEPGHEV